MRRPVVAGLARARITPVFMASQAFEHAALAISSYKCLGIWFIPRQVRLTE